MKQVLGCNLDSAALVEAARMGQPLVFRGAALGWEGRKAFERKKFVSAFGNFRCTSSEIPYGDQFLEVVEKQVALKDVASAALEEGVHHNMSRLQHAANYVFITSTDTLGCERGFADAFSKAVRAPGWLPMRDQEGVYEGYSQFYLGGRGTGSPLHFHTDAANVLAYGRKLYILYPPPYATFSAAATLEGLQQGVYNGSSVGSDPVQERVMQLGDYGAGVHAGIEFVQEAGDVVFVPGGWGHLILNLEPSIGIAYEMLNWEGQPIGAI
eukprot:gnl/MRDRNA2_/MRDRNA2_132865_c0_seq1.p1 gnl/MRDRNA2_/MRDRNA2_132865_c0~~gnl/MRDRNA2_/MRDRNA2_132865_c0_seq1.p1  ORF type:complete len:268 (-),score=50.66 gnl/MRDRNA2_/MRDRNA2_132865_c0_seq1:58-861(-)